MKYVDVVGKTYGLLKVVSQAGVRDRMICECSCGKVKEARLSHLKSGSVKSCGCLLKTTPQRVHGTTLMSKTSEYKAWASMIDRCTNKNHKAYKNYGARGISVCKEWLGTSGFFRFLEDMGKKPEKRLSLDRKNNNAGYSKENCRWATSSQQLLNTRANHLLTFNGRTMPLIEWARECGISKTTIGERLKRGWSVEKALTYPLRRTSSSAQLVSPSHGQNPGM